MTDQEINERVAFLCGWFYHVEWHKEGIESPCNPPNYAESLDACREFECSLSEDDRHNYGRLIGNLERFDHLLGGNRITALITVTALERCEAFLRLKGQWE